MMSRDTRTGEPRWLLNGVPDALLDPNDRGLLYADGLFETVAFHHRRPPLWSLHMARLMRGCRELGLPAPDPEQLLNEALTLVGARTRAVVRITLTRGVGGAGYVPDSTPAAPTRLLIRRDFPVGLDQLREQGLRLFRWPRPLGVAGPAGTKHLARLQQVLIGSEMRRRNADEAVVVDAEGYLIEALAGNLVLVRDGRLIEAEPHPAAVEGVGLAWLRDAAGPTIERARIRIDELRSDDALWVINSVRGPIGACTLDGAAMPRDPLIDEWQRRWLEEIES
ncbi:MAG: aminodeoxychorismate lyase [Wenzhouxiangellaceae bacterium]